MPRTNSRLSQVLRMLAPRACAVCGCRLATEEEVICGACDFHLPRTNYVHWPAQNEMARLFWLRLPIEKAAALFHYQGHSEVARMIYDLKYHDHPELGEQLGIMAAREMAEEGFFEGIDLIIPVPLARKRLRERGYNQSEWIGKGIREQTGIPMVTDAIARTRFEESQTKRQRLGRIENVENAFQLLRPERVAGKHVLLVDDVCTTGATLTACGKQLAQAPDVRISVFTLARAQG